jgi:predicted Rossmann fold nucleotide-binding protein DprA/Smf involved in DNA uptake
MKGVNLEGKKVAVIGSRSFSDREKLYSVLTKNKAKIKLIVSGGARGADTLATQWATDYGVPYLVFPALWRNPETLAFDRGAGMRRNRLIVEYSDVVIAFYDGSSKGTANSIEIAKQLNKPLKIILFESVQEASEPSQEA